MSSKRGIEDVEKAVTQGAADDVGVVVGRKPLIHRSRLEMWKLLRVFLLVFPVELLDCVLDYMADYRLLAVLNPTVYRFYAVWYDLFDDREKDAPLTSFLEQYHASRLEPEKPAHNPSWKRRVNRSSEIRHKRPKQDQLANARAQNAQELFVAHLDVAPHTEPATPKLPPPVAAAHTATATATASDTKSSTASSDVEVPSSLAVFRFGNHKMSLRSMVDLDRAYPLSVKHQADVDALSKYLRGKGRSCHLPLSILSGARLIGLRHARGGSCLWDRVDQKMIWSDDRFNTPESEYGRYSVGSEKVTHGDRSYLLEMSKSVRVMKMTESANRTVELQWLKGW